MNASPSIVVVTYNSAHCLEDCIRSAKEVAPGSDILVVDNASTDGSAELAGELGAAVVRSPANVGFGAACNLGLAAASGRWVVLMNPDVELRQLELSEPPAPIGAMAGVLSREGRPYAPDVRPELTFAEDFVQAVVLRLLPRAVALRYPHRARSGSWVSGALVAVDRSALAAVGGFDERFFLYYEDRDLCRRLRRAGYTLSICDTLRGRHQGSASSATSTVGSEALAIASWIEYQAIWRGPAYARLAARLAVSTISAGARLYGSSRSGPRATARAAQLAEIRWCLQHLESHEASRYAYPDALRALDGT